MKFWKSIEYVVFHHYVLDNFTGDLIEGLKEHEAEEFDGASEVREVIEGQFLSMLAHSERFGMPNPPKRIITTGGASANQSILESIATIFGCDIYTVQLPDSASVLNLRKIHCYRVNGVLAFKKRTCKVKNYNFRRPCS